MSQNLQNVARFQKLQLDNLVDFEKCCKTRIFLQRSVPIQPKTSNILPIGRRVADRCRKITYRYTGFRNTGLPVRKIPLDHREGEGEGADRRDEGAELRGAPGVHPRGRRGEEGPAGARGEEGRRAEEMARDRGGLLLSLGKVSKISKIRANFCKFLTGSFSAVSKRNFARKYAFDSIFQALQDLHPFAPLQSQNFRKKSV